VLIPERIPALPSPVALSGLIVRQLGGETMGTTWSVKLAARAGTDLGSLERGIDEVLRRIVAEMSNWQPASHISRFNAAPAGSWHRLPDGFFKVLATALHWAERTGGAYDPTVGAAVNLWGFGPDPALPELRNASDLPDAEALQRARVPSGWQRVKLDAESRSAFQPGGLQLDLCAIAKGFAVDEVVRALRNAGVANLLVEIGGELRGEGLKPGGMPWWIELERPRQGSVSDGGNLDTVLALSGVSVATSGDERRYFDRDGRRYSHTLDPRTGRPVAHDLVSVTVVAEDCMTADVLATALTVLGPEQGPAFAEANGVAARFVSFDGQSLTERLTPAMAAMLN
jgi:thiamine biosynthesis lipoprotein